MEQLSGFDSLLLFEDRGNVCGHVTGLGLYDPATVPGGRLRFRAMLDHFERQLASGKVYRRRLAQVPHGIDRAYWINDPDVDVEYHVRHIALPRPGDWRQLMIQVARIHSRALDLGKPLWEVYLIEGLENIPDLPPDTFAAVFKFHAAGMAGQPIAEAIRGLHTTAPDEPSLALTHALTADREPAALEMYAHAIGQHARRSIRLTRHLARASLAGSRHVVGRLWRREHAANDATPAFQRAPHTRFNEPLSAARVVEAVMLPFAGIDTIRTVLPQITRGDVLFATLGGALRLYLRQKEELPESSLRALLPLALREPGHASRIGPSPVGLPVTLATDQRDPVQRLLAIHAASNTARHGAIAELARIWAPELIDDLPLAATELAIRHGLMPQVNCIAALVDGPATPLYLAGAQALRFYPIGRPVDQAALNVSAYAYRDHLWVGVGACRQALPDPAFFADCLRAAFEELAQAVARHAERKQATAAKRRTPRKSRARAA